MKSFLILSFLFYLKASIISDTRLKNTMSDIKLQDQSDNFIKNEDRETKLIQAIIVTKELINCLTRTKIIPKTIIDTIKAQKTIIVTEDFEYLADSQYNNFTRDLINSGINFCINENEGLSLNDIIKSLRIENDNCNMTKLEELIQTYFPNKYKTIGIISTSSRAGESTEVETYSNLKKYVYDLISQSCSNYGEARFGVKIAVEFVSLLIIESSKKNESILNEFNFLRIVKQYINKVNEEWSNKAKEMLEIAIANVKEFIRYEFIQLKRTGIKRKLIDNYFNVVGNDPNDKSKIFLCNGWVMQNEDPNEVYPDITKCGTWYYFKRKVIVWPDTIKLNYGHDITETNKYLIE